MKILLDMNLTTKWVKFLAEHDIDAVHWSSVGRADAADDDLIEYAAVQDYVIMTNDLGFGLTLITQGRSKPSVIQLRSDDLSPSTLGAVVVGAIADHKGSLARGSLITIDPSRARVRLLNLADDF